MVLPVGTDLYAPRAPRTTPTLVVLNGMVYMVMLLLAKNGHTEELRSLLSSCALSDSHFRFWQPITYQFLHDPSDIWHLVGNMAFLWVFGAALESRMRWWGFALLYLTGGMVAGGLNLLLSGGAVIGASGSVSAVTGAFIVLFPRARVTVLFFTGFFPIPAMLLIALYFALDFLGVLGASEGGVAHWAHLGGTGFGFLTACGLLATGLLRRTDLDLVFLLKQMRRRHAMRSAVRSAEDGRPWQGSVSTRLKKEEEPAPRSPRSSGDSAAAARASALGADTLRRHTGAAADASAPQTAGVNNSQLAKRLHEEGTEAFARADFEGAAAAFTRSVQAAPSSADADQTRLMLVVIYARKLNDPARARAVIADIGMGLQASHRPLLDALKAEVGA